MAVAVALGMAEGARMAVAGKVGRQAGQWREVQTVVGTSLVGIEGNLAGRGNSNKWQW